MNSKKHRGTRRGKDKKGTSERANEEVPEREEPVVDEGKWGSAPGRLNDERIRIRGFAAVPFAFFSFVSSQ